MTRHFTLAATLALFSLAMPQAYSADMPAMGPWNAGAVKTAEGSPLAQSAMAMIKGEIAHIADENLRKETEDAVFNADTCIRHRAGLDGARKQAIIDKLTAEGLIDATEAGRIPGGLLAGVFPPVRDDGSACPKLPQPYFAAPGRLARRPIALLPSTRMS